MIPPCINKFYILDLQPENSMIRFLAEQGHTVFVASWKNPREAEQHLTWDDYIELGPIAALRVAREICGVRDVNALGFCVGGTIIVTALAVLAARGERPVASLTLLTALVDFEDSGVLDIFIDENHVRAREKQFGQGGLMPGKDLANTFSSLRANDLVWNYVVSNYLEGRAPPAFDLLYWNGDSTNVVLERRFDQFAGQHVCVVPAQYLPGKQFEDSEQAHCMWCADRYRPSDDADLRVRRA